MRVVIYRTSERPIYTVKSFRHLLENTNPSTPIIVINNTDNTTQLNAAVEAIESAQLLSFGKNNDVNIYSFNSKLGGTQAIVEGIAIAKDRFKDLSQIMVTDDDVLCPMPAHGADTMMYWDDVLSNMLNNGWNMAAHPWADSFRSDKDIVFKRKGDPHTAGYVYSCVGGGCSGFNLSEYDKRPFHNDGLIRGYNEWMLRLPTDTCGYSYIYNMTITHFDRPEHQWSLRDSDYGDWANEMYWARWPDRRDPSHPNHERPKGKLGVW